MAPGPNVIKLFTSVIYECFTWVGSRLDWKGLPDTNTSLLQKFVNYGQKRFYHIGPGLKPEPEEKHGDSEFIQTAEDS